MPRPRPEEEDRIQREQERARDGGAPASDGHETTLQRQQREREAAAAEWAAAHPDTADNAWDQQAFFANSSSADVRRDARNRMHQQLLQDAPNAGDLTPEYSMEDAVGNISADPEGLAAQRDALSAMQDVYHSGGMTAADRMAMQARQRGVAQAERGQREAVQQQAASRGMLGSGMEYAGQQAAVQAGTNTLADMEAQSAADASARALAAMQGAGGLGSNMRAQGDAISEFNANYMRGVNERNAATRNRQQDANVNARQGAWENKQAAFYGQPRKAAQAGNRTESTLAGAGSGAVTGAKFGPYGALIGGGLGAVTGFFGGHDDQEEEW